MQNTSNKIERVGVRVLSIFLLFLVGLSCIPTTFSAAKSNLALKVTSAGSANTALEYEFSIALTKPREKISIPVKVTFPDDLNNSASTRTTVSLELRGQNDVSLQTHTLDVSSTSTSSFDFTFDEVYKNDDKGNPISYSVLAIVQGHAYKNSSRSIVGGGEFIYHLRTFSLRVVCYDETDMTVGSGQTTTSVKYAVSNTVMAPEFPGFEVDTDRGPASLVFSGITSNPSVEAVFYYKTKTGSGTNPGDGGTKPLSVTTPAAAMLVPEADARSQIDTAGIINMSPATNTEPYVLSAADVATYGLTEVSPGVYTVRLRAGSTLTMALDANVNYKVTFKAAYLKGSEFSLKSKWSLSGEQGTVGSGAAINFSYSPDYYRITVFYIDIDTGNTIAPTDTTFADAAGNAWITSKTIQNYKVIAPESKTFSGITEDQVHTFYYKTTDVPEGMVLAVGVIQWEEASGNASRPASVNVELLQNGKLVASTTVQTSVDFQQAFSFPNQPSFDDNKKPFNYTIRLNPSAITGYQKPEISGDAEQGFLIVYKQKEKSFIDKLRDPNERDGDIIPLGTLDSDEHASLFNIVVGLMGASVILISTFSEIVSNIMKKRQRPRSTKSPRNGILRWITIALSAITILLTGTEDLSRPIGVFNMNSVLFIPVLIILFVTIVVFLLSRRIFVILPAEEDDEEEDSSHYNKPLDANGAYSSAMSSESSADYMHTYISKTVSSELAKTNSYKRESWQSDSVSNAQDTSLHEIVLAGSGTSGITSKSETSEFSAPEPPFEDTKEETNTAASDEGKWFQ